MVHRALRRLATVQASPRAKSLSPRLPPRLSSSSAQSLARLDDAVRALDTALADQQTLGVIDACYGALCDRAAALIAALLADPGAARALSPASARGLGSYVRRERLAGVDAEADVQLAEAVLGELR